MGKTFRRDGSSKPKGGKEFKQFKNSKKFKKWNKPQSHEKSEPKKVEDINIDDPID